MKPSEDPKRGPSDAPDPAADPTQGLAQHLIRFAAQNAPTSLSARLEEEWLADLAARHTGFGRVLFALGCCWATRTITLAHVTPATAATGASPGYGAATTFWSHDATPFSHRTIVIMSILILHAVVIYGFMTGLGHGVIEVPPPPITGHFIDPQRPPDQIPSLPPPTLRARPLEWPQPEHFDFTVPVAPLLHDPVDVFEPTTTLAGARSVGVTRVSGGPGPGFPATDDFYPPASRRDGEQGSATVRVCVDVTGRLTSNPTLVQPSGSARLDEAALKLARAGSGHYRSTTEDGHPVTSCYPYRIRFRMVQ